MFRTPARKRKKKKKDTEKVQEIQVYYNKSPINHRAKKIMEEAKENKHYFQKIKPKISS